MCSRKVVVKPLIFRLLRTLPVSQRLRFLCLIHYGIAQTSGHEKLHGPVPDAYFGLDVLEILKGKSLTVRVTKDESHCLRPRMSSLRFFVETLSFLGQGFFALEFPHRWQSSNRHRTKYFLMYRSVTAAMMH